MPSGRPPPDADRLVGVEVAEDHDHGPPRRPADPRKTDAELGLERGRGRGDQGPDDLGEMPDAAGGHELDLEPIADHEQPDPVAIVHRRRRQEGRGLRGAIGLGAPLGAEPHAGRDVDHQPERERPLLDIPSHERLSLPGRDVPVEMAHVVTRLIGAKLRERQPDSRPCPMIGPRQLRDRLGPNPKPEPAAPGHDLRGVHQRL